MACKLQPEPNNPVDARAIAFRVHLDERWSTIGYVVREALNEAISEKKLTAVTTDWVKYKIYAGVKLTCIGEWLCFHKVLKCISHCLSTYCQNYYHHTAFIQCKSFCFTNNNIIIDDDIMYELIGMVNKMH